MKRPELIYVGDDQVVIDFGDFTVNLHVASNGVIVDCKHPDFNTTRQLADPTKQGSCRKNVGRFLGLFWLKIEQNRLSTHHVVVQ